MSSRTTAAISYALCITICCALAATAFAETKRPLSPEACTEVRYLASDEVISHPALQLSHDGKQVAYVVQSPNFASDEYKDELYVARLDGTAPSSTLPITVNARVAAVTWFPDNRHLAILTNLHSRIVLARVDSVTRTSEVIKEAQGDITDYSMDSTGDTIAIAVKLPTPSTFAARTLTENHEGYRLSLDSVAPPYRSRRHVYLLRSSDSHHWEMGPPLSFVSPLSGRQLTELVDYHFLHITISPNGRYLLLENIEQFSDITLKGAWEHSQVVKYLAGRLEGVQIGYLYDLHTHAVSIPLESPNVSGGGVWAPDGNSYVQVALAPVGSKWEDADLDKAAPTNHSFHLFSVDVHTGTIREVVARTARPPLAWTKSGELIVQDDTGSIHTLAMSSDEWREKDSFEIPLSKRSPYTPMASDGQRFVMEYENISTAPELLQFDRTTARINTVVKLNPQVDALRLPRIENMAWVTSTGYKATGVLLLPPDYDPSRRYPLVIENGSILYEGQFVCDSGADHVSSFARGLLADSGIVYLMRSWPGNDNWKNNYYPRGYPGEIGEAAFQLDLVESAVQYLDDRRMIDPTKIGLIGFSRGGWYTEYALVHSHLAFQAATATDNILYSTGEYWYLYDNAAVHALEGMYGGPPYGASLKNWLDYSISFNLDKIHTPLLMEVMGYGRKNDDPYRPLNNLAKHYEEFVGLSRLAKPVELYYYPEEQHQVDHPMARIASLRRNVDWYRFWLQGYERPNVDDPDQYKRWEHLRQLQKTDAGDTGTTASK